MKWKEFLAERHSLIKEYKKKVALLREEHIEKLRLLRKEYTGEKNRVVDA